MTDAHTLRRLAGLQRKEARLLMQQLELTEQVEAARETLREAQSAYLRSKYPHRQKARGRLRDAQLEVTALEGAQDLLLLEILDTRDEIEYAREQGQR